MSDSQSIIGFTEAELGFFLALLCVVLWLTALKVQPVKSAPTPISADSVRHLLDLADSAQVRARRLDSIRAIIDKKGKPDSLRSSSLPKCSAVSRASGPIARILVLGDERIIVNGKTTTLTAYRNEVKPVVDEVRNICRHQVVVSFADTLGAVQSENARGLLNSIGLTPIAGGIVRGTH